MNSYSSFGGMLARGGGGAKYYKKYIIQVVSNVFSVDSVVLKDLTAEFLPGKTYKFDQSDPSNVGYSLVFGVLPDGANTTTAGIFYTSYGTPGNPGAYTKLVIANSGFVAGALYYYSLARSYMGYGPPTVSVDISPVSQSSSFIFTIINRTNATIGYSISGQNTFWPLTAGQLGLTSLTSTTVSSGLTTISCTNTSSVHQTITYTLTNVTPTTAVTAVMQGPAAYLQVSTASSVPYGSSFTYTINNTTASAITYSLTSTPTLVFTDLSLSNAAAITNVSVAAGVRSTVTCWNKSSAAKTVVLSSSGLTSVQAVLNALLPPTITFNPATTAAQGASFTVSIYNPNEVSVTAVLSTGGTTAVTLTDLTIASDTLVVAAGTTGVFNCVNAVTADKTVTCTAGLSTNTVTASIQILGPPGLNAIEWISRNTPTTALTYGRQTAMSGDGLVYAFTSGAATSQVFHIFSTLTNLRIGSAITDATTNNNTEKIRLNYDGTILFSSSTYGNTRHGLFQAHAYNTSTNAWTLKGSIIGNSASFNMGLGGHFSTNDNGNIVHIAYGWNHGSDTPIIQSFTHNGTSYVYKNGLSYTSSGQTLFGRIFSGSKDGTRLAVPVVVSLVGAFIVYDWNTTNFGYTQVGSTISYGTANTMLETRICANGSTVVVNDQNNPSGPYRVYTLISNAWTLMYTSTATSNVNTLPKINSDGTIFAVTSTGATANVSNKVFYYSKNGSTYSSTKTMDLSLNIANASSTAFSENLYTFVSGVSDFSSNSGCIDLYGIPVFTPVLSLTNFAVNLGSTTGVGYNSTTYSTNAATGITFNGSGSGYVMYGTSDGSTTSNCLNIGKNSFKLVFDATHSNTDITSQHCWATTPNQAVGLLYFFTSNTPYVICYSATGTVQFVGSAMAYGTKATFTLMRYGTKLSCTMVYNNTTSNMTASAPNANFTYSGGVVTANSLTNNQDLGVFPLRIGGWATNSAGANYATANTNAGNQVFKGTINNFIYYRLA